MQAPTLFIIAADLTKMQVNANIDEADVGRIRPGQHVTFRVDAYPTETFEGTVSQIRLQPVVVQNVTTYGTVIDVPNPQLKLKPGMTANVKVEIAKRTDVLRVPNAALRFRPTADVFAALNQPVPPEAQSARRRTRRARRQGRARGGGRRRAATLPAGGAHRGGDRRRLRAADWPPGRQRRSRRRERRQPAAPAVRAARTAAAGRQAPAAADGDADSIRARHDGALQGHVARRAEAVHRAHEGARPGHQRVRSRQPHGDRRAAAARQAEVRRAAPAQTIDALFAPLPTVETRGRVWLFMDKQLKPVNLRLGITDGTNTELLSGELQHGHGSRDRRHRRCGTTRAPPGRGRAAIR